jgi:sulfatase-like protein
VMLAAPSRLWVVALAALVAGLLLVLLYWTFRWALRSVADAATRPGERRALFACTAVVIALWAGQRAEMTFAEGVRFSPPVSATYARQARLIFSSLRGSVTIAAGPPMNSDLSRVRGADVFVFFIEAYGSISYERPEFVARLAADRIALAAAIQETQRGVVSAFVESPTFGGSSWLAHITLLSGIEIRSHDANALLMSEQRDTLVTDFKQHGYRTVAVMPGLWQNWPEGKFYGFDDIYGGERLDYQGPEFGWWDMTDQFALARMDALEVNRGPRQPLFLFMPTISTHIPFTPTPPYQPDWRRMLTNAPYDDADVDRANLRQPDWDDLGPSYADALSYMYKSLAGYLRLRADRDAVFVILGDHQPAAAVSGEGASWDVPVHIIASRQAVLDQFVAQGFHPGVTPERPTLGPMPRLTSILLDAFGDPDAAAAAKTSPN